MGKQKGIAEGVVFDEAHIPAEYEALGPVHASNKRHHNALVKACENNKIRRIRFRRSAGDIYGHLYVHREDAAEVLRESDQRFAERGSHGAARLSTGVDNHSPAVCDISACAIRSLESLNSTLDEIYGVLERLTTAVESMATQPKAEPAGSWRDMNGEQP